MTKLSPMFVMMMAAGCGILDPLPGDKSSGDDTVDCDAAVPPPKACADGQDNDGDGLTDLRDPGCANADDDDETDPVPTHICDDGRDWTVDRELQTGVCEHRPFVCGGAEAKLHSAVPTGGAVMVYYAGFGGPPGGPLIAPPQGGWPTSMVFQFWPSTACHAEARARDGGRLLKIDCRGQWLGLNPDPNTGEGRDGRIEPWTAQNVDWCNWDKLGMPTGSNKPGDPDYQQYLYWRDIAAAPPPAEVMQ